MAIIRLGGLSRRLGGKATHPSVLSSGKGGFSQASAGPQTGLTFPVNYTANSDIRLRWDGADMVPRFLHTVIWKARHVQQDGFYAWAWHTLADGTWGFGTAWPYGTHPYPATGAVDGNGYSTGGTGDTGEVHYHEIANGGDKLASDGGSGLLVVKDVWLSQARTCEQVGSDYVHRYWPDIDGNPSFSIVWTVPTSTYPAPGTHMFCFGASPWSQYAFDTTATQESPAGDFRHFMMYDRALSLTEIQAKLAMTTDDTTDADVWYCNLNPTPTDISDKSGQGHDPTWDNSNRPTLWEP